MEVTLISHTQDAMELLIYTKQTRMSMSPGAFAAIKGWEQPRKEAEINYMLHTIQSSWEFVEYVFVIEGAPRSFTHQLVRTRHASYAQQSQRLAQGEDIDTHMPDKIAEDGLLRRTFDEAMEAAQEAYDQLLRDGADAQDAREVLPNASCSNIVMKVSLRALHDFLLKRLCVRAQGMAQQVAREMRKAVIAVHPWSEPFLRVWCATHGTCQFHNHPMELCPVKPFVYNPHTGMAYDRKAALPATIEHIQDLWEKMGVQHVQPKAHSTSGNDAKDGAG